MRSIALALVAVGLIAPNALASPRLVAGAAPRCARDSQDLRGLDPVPWRAGDAPIGEWGTAPVLAEPAPAPVVEVAPAPVAAANPTLLVKIGAAVGEARATLRAATTILTALPRVIVGKYGFAIFGTGAKPAPAKKPKMLTLF
jgi:hypothetical protein